MGLPPIGETLADAGLDIIGIYVTRHQNTMAQYIATRPIINIAIVEGCRPGHSAILQWREHAVIRFRDGVEEEVEA